MRWNHLIYEIAMEAARGILCKFNSSLLAENGGPIGTVFVEKNEVCAKEGHNFFVYHLDRF